MQPTDNFQEDQSPEPATDMPTEAEPASPPLTRGMSGYFQTPANPAQDSSSHPSSKGLGRDSQMPVKTVASQRLFGTLTRKTVSVAVLTIVALLVVIVVAFKVFNSGTTVDSSLVTDDPEQQGTHGDAVEANEGEESLDLEQEITTVTVIIAVSLVVFCLIVVFKFIIPDIRPQSVSGQAAAKDVAARLAAKQKKGAALNPANNDRRMVVYKNDAKVEETVSVDEGRDLTDQTASYRPIFVESDEDD